MNREEIREKFYKNVAYLQRNVPPDDIYIFSEQTFLAALYFLKKWSEVADINKECESDQITEKWVSNILGFLEKKELDEDIIVNLDLDSIED